MCEAAYEAMYLSIYEPMDEAICLKQGANQYYIKYCMKHMYEPMFDVMLMKQYELRYEAMLMKQTVKQC